MPDIKEFKSKDEMIEWGKENLGKFDSILCCIEEQKYLLCGTDLAYEDEVWGIATRAIQEVLSVLGLPEFDEQKNFDYAGLVPYLKDFLMSYIPDIEEIEVVHAFDEY